MFCGCEKEDISVLASAVTIQSMFNDHIALCRIAMMSAVCSTSGIHPESQHSVDSGRMVERQPRNKDKEML